MKKIYFSLVFALITSFTIAQTGKVVGTVNDADSKSPVEFATIALNDPTTNKPVDGTIADAKGKFIIKGIATGK